MSSAGATAFRFVQDGWGGAQVVDLAHRREAARTTPASLAGALEPDDGPEAA